MASETLHERFGGIARNISNVSGSWPAFACAVALIVGWLVCGLFVDFTNPNYQMFINSVTTVITFLMVFLVQNTQNRDMAAIHLKLDALIIAADKVSNEVAAAETLPDADIVAMKVKVVGDTT